MLHPYSAEQKTKIRIMTKCYAAISQYIISGAVFLLLLTNFRTVYSGRLLRKIGLYYPTYGSNTNQLSNSNRSPCPNVFEYRYDEYRQLFGFLEIQAPDSNVIELLVEFCVGNQVGKGAEGTITLPYQNQAQIIDLILQRKPLNYKVNFPVWYRLQPKITKISVNGQILCTDQPYPSNSVPVLTSIYLTHKLKLNVSPLDSTGSIQGNQNNVGNIGNPSFDVRNDGSTGISPIPNKYNFNPGTPIVVPEIIFKPENPSVNNDKNPYVKNPFLNNFYITPRPSQGSENGYDAVISPIDSGTLAVTGRTPSNVNSQENVTPTIKWRPSTDFVDGTPQNYNSVCGLPVVTNSLVLNGQSVPKGAFPWLAAMFVKTNSGLEYQCTGTLVSRQHVITASHCVKPDSYVLNPDKVVLVMGRMNIQRWDATEGEKIIGADQIFVHPDYQPSTADADISVIKLKAYITFSKFIRPICLWQNDVDLSSVVGKRGIVVGWGKDETGLRVSPEPKQIRLPVVSQEQCLRSNYTFLEITSDRTFCAGERNGSGPCNGDSGSGLIMSKNGRWHLKGIVSMSLSDPHTRTCDLSNYVVFTDASKFSKWVLSLLQ